MPSHSFETAAQTAVEAPWAVLLIILSTLGALFHPASRDRRASAMASRCRLDVSSLHVSPKNRSAGRCISPCGRLRTSRTRTRQKGYIVWVFLVIVVCKAWRAATMPRGGDYDHAAIEGGRAGLDRGIF